MGYYPGTLSSLSGYFNSFEDRVPFDEIYPIFYVLHWNPRDVIMPTLSPITVPGALQIGIMTTMFSVYMIAKCAPTSGTDVPCSRSLSRSWSEGVPVEGALVILDHNYTTIQKT